MWIISFSLFQNVHKLDFNFNEAQNDVFDLTVSRREALRAVTNNGCV